MRFPSKKAAYVKKIALDEDDVRKEKKLATPVTVSEVWFTWYEKQPNTDEYERIEGVGWVDLKNDFIFKKMKNPNWDCEGEKILVQYDREKGESVDGSIRQGERRISRDRRSTKT
jgi:hypothetical protein